MAEYTLTLTAAEIDIALNRVTNPDQAPLFNSEELVTSGGVKNYVDTQISVLNGIVTDLANEVDINTSSLLSSAVIVTTGNRATTLTVNVGTFLNRAIANPLATVDYITCALYVQTGNHDSLNVSSVSVKDNNAYGCVSAVSAKTAYYAQPYGQWQHYDNIMIPTMGFSSGNYTFRWSLVGTGDWYLRADITAYVGKPA
jgi:hypothetical protein